MKGKEGGGNRYSRWGMGGAEIGDVCSPSFRTLLSPPLKPRPREF